jgi:hypothetical protein
VINIERLTIAEEDLDESSVTKVTVQKIRLLHICLCCREFAKINSNDAKKKLHSVFMYMASISNISFVHF